MIWKDYSKLKNTHAFCGASKYSWRNWDIEKLLQSKVNSYATTIGTLLHDFAARCITRKFRLNKSDKRMLLLYLHVEHDIPEEAIDVDRIFPTMQMYVNDAIGFRMDPEITLYYSDDFYGTTDAISWRDNCLRISDLKTGITPASFEQLENYAAFFCLDYKVKPSQIEKLEFRIYQNGEIALAEPDPEIIFPIIDQIIEFNKALMAFEGR